MKPRNPPLLSERLLDQVRERVRYLHCSLSIEKNCIGFVFSSAGTITHPREMGRKQVEAFLSMLATYRKVSAPMHNQALSALPFLYRGVLEMASGGTAHTTSCANNLNI